MRRGLQLRSLPQNASGDGLPWVLRRSRRNSPRKQILITQRSLSVGLTDSHIPARDEFEFSACAVAESLLNSSQRSRSDSFHEKDSHSPPASRHKRAPVPAGLANIEKLKKLGNMYSTISTETAFQVTSRGYRHKRAREKGRTSYQTTTSPTS